MVRGAKGTTAIEERARALARASIARADALFGADRALDRPGGGAKDGDAGGAHAARVRLAVKIADEYASVRAWSRGERARRRTEGRDGRRERGEGQFFGDEGTLRRRG